MKFDYTPEQCFNLLTILFTPCFSLVDQMVTARNCCVAFFHDHLIRKPGEHGVSIVKVSFFPHRIHYTFHNVLHIQDERNTVEYIYFIMRIMNLAWMTKVLAHVKQPYPLSLLCKMHLPLASKESIFRRFVTPNGTIIREFTWRGGTLNGDSYGEYFKRFMSFKRKYNHNKTIRERKETIYMHDLFCYGAYSEEMNFYTLPQMLMAEAILFSTHVWHEIYEGCYYCNIEKYHMIIWRQQWRNNIEIYQFLDEQLCTLIKHKTLPLQENSLVNAIDGLSDNVMVFQYRFCDLMVEQFFSRRHPFQIKSLKELCEFQIIMGLLIKKLEIMKDALDQEKQLFTSQSENLSQYRMGLSQVCNQMWDLGMKYLTTQFNCDINGRQYCFDPPNIMDCFKRIICKGTIVPLQCHQSMAKLSNSYRQFGAISLQRFSFLSPNL